MNMHGKEYLKIMCGGCVDVNWMETVHDLSDGPYDICDAELSSSGTKKLVNKNTFRTNLNSRRDNYNIPLCF
jgi:hypothetical protein